MPIVIKHTFNRNGMTTDYLPRKNTRQNPLYRRDMQWHGHVEPFSLALSPALIMSVCNITSLIFIRLPDRTYKASYSVFTSRWFGMERRGISRKKQVFFLGSLPPSHLSSPSYASSTQAILVSAQRQSGWDDDLLDNKWLVNGCRWYWKQENNKRKKPYGACAVIKL